MEYIPPPDMNNEFGELQYELKEEIFFKLYSLTIFDVYSSKVILPSFGVYTNKLKG